MNTSFKGGLAVWCACVVSASAPSQRSAVQAIVREATALGVRTGCVLLGSSGQEILCAHRASEPFAPASNQKLVTAIAALAGLGVDYEFATVFELRDGILRVRGGGDPNWKSGTAHSPAEIFAAVVQRLKEARVAAVRGIALDVEMFGGATRPAGWPEDQLRFYYCPPTGGLVLEEGCFRARLSPGGNGEADVTVLAPPVDLAVEGALQLTSNKKKGQRYSVWEDGGRLFVDGWFYARGKPREVVGAVSDPLPLFERALQRALRAGGIDVDDGAPPRDLDVGVRHTELREALVPMMVDSSNFHAEQVLRVLGAETRADGSFAGGAAAVREQVGELLGTVPGALFVADGSGLSRANRVSPLLLARMLAVARDPQLGGVLEQTLPVPGEGSLRRRFRGASVAERVRAKTGWIRGVSALSGYVDGRPFSILMNYAPERRGLNSKLKAIQERIVAAMASVGGS